MKSALTVASQEQDTNNGGSSKNQAQEETSVQEAKQLSALLGMIFERYGLDFRDYAQASLRRRVLRRLAEEKVDTISDLQALALKDPACMERLLNAMTVHVSAMFRDPEFYQLFREQAVPVLRTYPFLRLWVAGCSTGEEIYSLAILLHEEGLYSRCRIYATDVSELALDKAKAGIFPLSSMQEYTRNYQAAGGKRTFSDYYTAAHREAIFRAFLKENIIFARHNLVSDSSFNEFHVIFCRNVLMYFKPSLQDRVHRLLYESLAIFGYLGMGRSESPRFTAYERYYESVSPAQPLYRRIL